MELEFSVKICRPTTLSMIFETVEKWVLILPKHSLDLFISPEFEIFKKISREFNYPDFY